MNNLTETVTEKP